MSNLDIRDRSGGGGSSSRGSVMVEKIRLAVSAGRIGHSRPCKVHDVQRDDGRL